MSFSRVCLETMSLSVLLLELCKEAKQIGTLTMYSPIGVDMQSSFPEDANFKTRSYVR